MGFLQEYRPFLTGAAKGVATLAAVIGVTHLGYHSFTWFQREVLGVGDPYEYRKKLDPRPPPTYRGGDSSEV